MSGKGKVKEKGGRKGEGNGRKERIRNVGGKGKERKGEGK